jgi:hypothetical protein
MKKIIFTLFMLISISQLNAQSVKNKKVLQKDTTPTSKSKNNCDPVLRFGKHTGNCSISKSELLQSNCVFFTCPDFVMVSFEFTKSPHTSFINLGNKFSAEILNELKNLKNNQRIFFENVKAKGPDGIVRNMPGMTIKVID